MQQNYIAHIDMDAFFASCEEKYNPSYKGKPIIVGSDPKGGKGRGVVAACSYAARKFGIHSAMPISIAYNKCPHGVFVTPHMDRYATESYKIFKIFEKFTPDIEPISVDEAFLDITGSHQHFGGPIETCKTMKREIKNKLGLTASVGLAPNKMTAKIASDIKKPDGFVVVTPENLLNFIHPLPINKLWGIGTKTKKILNEINIATIGDLASRSSEEITDILGNVGLHLWELANGIDKRKVETFYEAKSIGNEYTFDKDTGNVEEIKDKLMYLSQKVSRRLREEKFLAKTVTLKIRLKNFETFTRSVTISEPTNYVDIIYKNVSEKFSEFKISHNPVRLIGVKGSNLINSDEKTDHFYGTSIKDIKKQNLYTALDKIIEKFGDDAITRKLL